VRRAIFFLLLAGGCKTTLDEGPLLPDLGRPGDLAGADFTAPPDLAGCAPPPDTGGGPCPCGMNGLCRPAGGRLSVQILLPNGQLRLTVMDDNGCNRHDVTSDHPIGVPRWAADGQRLAYITAGQTSVLHVIGVGANGRVTCKSEQSLGPLPASELAWAGDHTLWLLAPSLSPAKDGVVAEWRLGMGVISQQTVPWSQFDALPGPSGPFAAVAWNGMMKEVRFTKSLSDPGSVLAADPALGTVRLRAAGPVLVYSLNGFHVYELISGLDGQKGQPDFRSPAFARDGHAIVYVTDGGKLGYVAIDNGAQDEAMTGNWKAIYSPDWTPPAVSCDPLPDCN
jgi:hypothetical protein